MKRKSATLSSLAVLLALARVGGGGAPLHGQSPPTPPEPDAEVSAAAPGPTVTAVEVRSDAPLDPSLDLDTLIETEVGEPLTDEGIRHTLRNLQASGTAAETELYTRDDPAGGGVVVVIVFRAVVQVGEIRILGKPGLATEDLRRAIPQRVAEPLSEETVVQGVYALKSLYERSGYFQARVRVAVETNSLGRRAVVTYNVNSGPRSNLSAITFDHPVAPFQPAELIRQLRLQPNQPFSQRVAAEDAERLQSWLIKQGYGQARVDTPRADHDPGSTAVKLTYPISIGPKISLVVAGGDEKKLRREGLLPFLGEAGYDEALVLQAQERIKTYYQQQGHYDVTVETEEKPGAGQLVLTFRIVPGPVYTLRQIAFQGNHEVPDAKLRPGMKTTEPVLLRRGSGRLVQADLDADLDTLRRYYALNGYTQAVVGPAQVERKGEDLRLVIPVREGPRERVVHLSFQGFTALDPEALRKQLPLKENEGFHPVLLDNTLDFLRTEYSAKGYNQAQVSARQDWGSEHTLVDITLEALEGPRQVVDRILARGNQRTQSDVIRRTLGLDHGQPVSPARLLQTERSLYQLGIFSLVDVQFVPSDLDDTQRDVLVRVEEGNAHSLTYGAGWDSESGLRGLFGYSDNNIFGKAYSLQSNVRWSQRDKLYRLLLNQPYLGEHPVTLNSSVFYQEEVPTGRPYEVTRYGGRVEAVRVYGNRRFSVGFDYRIVEPSVDPGIATNEIERRDQPYQVTSFVPAFFWDRRDDPILTTRGWSSLVQLEYAFPVPAFRTDTEFLKIFVQQTQFWNLGRSGVLAASLRFGSIEPYKAIPSSGGLNLPFPSRNIPIAERFFAGGDASQRAYDRDELGIRGETLILNPNGGGYVPVGGDGLVLFNLEYRFPIVGDFGGTLFFDSGNVWPDWRSIRLNELKKGIGLGARYNSPIGPLRAGIGWKLDRDPKESGYALFVNIGNAF
jgi:outer membrane protein insertion porin family